MADELQICNGSWWSLARSIDFDAAGVTSVPSSIHCLSGGFDNRTTTETIEGKSRFRDEPVGSGSRSAISCQEIHQTQVFEPLVVGSSLMDYSSSMVDWNQGLIGSGGRVEPVFQSMLQEHLSSKPVIQQAMPIESNKAQGSVVNPTANLFEDMNQGFLQDNHYSSSGNEPGGNFPPLPASCGYPARLLQGLLEPETKSQQPLFHSPVAYRQPELLQSSLAKLPQFLKSSTTEQEFTNQLHFSNNIPFWNASSGAPIDISSGFYPSMPVPIAPSSFEQRSNCSKVTNKTNSDASQYSSSRVKKSNGEPVFKKLRIETPSSLPTFKVRKEKLGDRITALQQLVSPFGKTDTASVLYEAIEYIKFLHEQVDVLSNPYLKNGHPMQHQQTSNKPKDVEGTKKDLRSRGLCLVPIASTFPVASETPADFWTPTFGGTYR